MSQAEMQRIGILTPDWSVPSRLRAAFTLRSGGVSAAPFDSLNLGAHVGDVPQAVIENRARVRRALGLPGEPVWLTQVHGCDVLDLDAERDHPTDSGARDGRSGPGQPALNSGPKADAVVTRRPGRVCVIQVADCMPVLFAADDGSAVGAAHAGWRGLAGGVLEATVRKLGVAPVRVIAWMGPTISQAHFEVGDEVRAAFAAQDAGAESAFQRNERGRWQCDLYALARRRLGALGIRQVFGGGWCTYQDAARFFSFRRDGQCGRMAALIWME